MRSTHLTGPGAGVMKYDVLTALAVGGLHGSPGQHNSVLRLIALVTARYNWSRDEMSIGQRDMARIWNVDERTAKREVKRMVALRLIFCTRPGVRGRVASYRLDLAGIAAFSRAAWDSVGTDFSARIDAATGNVASAGEKVVAVDFAERRRRNPEGEGPWGRVRDLLESEHPEMFSNWFSRLEFAGAGEGALRLHAPNPFLRDYVATHLQGPLLRAIATEFGPVLRLDIALKGAEGRA